MTRTPEQAIAERTTEQKTADWALALYLGDNRRPDAEEMAKAAVADLALGRKT